MSLKQNVLKTYGITVSDETKTELCAAVGSVNVGERVKQVLTRCGITDVVVVYSSVLPEIAPVIGIFDRSEYLATLCLIDNVMEDGSDLQVVHVLPGTSLRNVETKLNETVTVKRRKATMCEFGIQKKRHDWQFKK